MNTWPIADETGKSFAFEIGNLSIGLKAVTSVLETVGEVSNIRMRRLFSEEPAEVHIKFLYQGIDFVVCEPFGDNSRYWIGPKDDATKGLNITELEQAFVKYRPSLLSRLLGG